MKLLSIGNSFSQDAHRYLHELAAANGESLFTWNLYIGGCSLQRHMENVRADAPLYALQENGVMTSRMISIREALSADAWDVITLQQVSGGSVDRNTFLPYLTELADVVRQARPSARLLLHQTWAYAADSENLHRLGFQTPEEMFLVARENYAWAAETIQADGVIPAGRALLQLHQAGVHGIHRDPIHASLGVGRLTLALTWFGYLFAQNPQNLTIDGVTLDEAVDTALFSAAKNAAQAALASEE